MERAHHVQSIHDKIQELWHEMTVYKNQWKIMGYDISDTTFDEPPDADEALAIFEDQIQQLGFPRARDSLQSFLIFFLVRGNIPPPHRIPFLIKQYKRIIRKRNQLFFTMLQTSDEPDLFDESRDWRQP